MWPFPNILRNPLPPNWIQMLSLADERGEIPSGSPFNSPSNRKTRVSYFSSWEIHLITTEPSIFSSAKCFALPLKIGSMTWCQLSCRSGPNLWLFRASFCQRRLMLLLTSGYKLHIAMNCYLTWWYLCSFPLRPLFFSFSPNAPPPPPSRPPSLLSLLLHFVFDTLPGLFSLPHCFILIAWHPPLPPHLPGCSMQNLPCVSCPSLHFYTLFCST